MGNVQRNQRKNCPAHEILRRLLMTEMRKNWVYRRGDIYIANLNPFRGSEHPLL